MIVADFMLSAREEAKLALRPEIERRFSLHGHLLPQATILDANLGVAPAYLDACFDPMRSERGTIEAWLGAIGVAAGGQIGRAAGEERVCEYVRVEGGGV